MDNAYHSGRLARCAGASRRDNPFPAGTTDWLDWLAGWEAGATKENQL